VEESKKMSILLVDDEAGIRKVLGISLGDIGYDVLLAKDGEEALEIFQKSKPPIVMTDIKMPGMNGIELLCQIKEKDPETEVIMITGHGELNLAIKSLKYEATDFVTKPINDDVLKIALKRAIERISIRNELKQYMHNLEHLVKEKTRELVKSERLSAIGKTVAGLSHAIKNIAGWLDGGAFILEKGIELDDKKYVLQGWKLLKGNVNKIRNLSMDLLNYAKPSEIKYALCHPNTPINEVVELMKSKAEEQSVQLKMQLNSNLEPFYFDPDGIYRCLLNLLTNALDACLDDGYINKEKIVEIRTEKIDGWGVEYIVNDNCCGMEDDVREKIFQEFFTTKGSRGTGIGLMLTKKIIDEHKGVIDVIAEKKKGSTFIIRLPKRSRSADEIK